MPLDERERRAALLREVVQRNDISNWLDNQLQAAVRLKLKGAVG